MAISRGALIGSNAFLELFTSPNNSQQQRINKWLAEPETIPFEGWALQSIDLDDDSGADIDMGAVIIGCIANGAPDSGTASGIPQTIYFFKLS